MSVPTSITPFDLTRTFTLDAAGKDQPVDRDKLVKMAQEFEGMLLLQMVRQMRQSMLMDEEEDTGLGNATMTDTFDVEFANYLAKQGGIGLSKAIEQQIEKSEKVKADAAARPAAEGPPSPLPLSPGRGGSISAATAAVASQTTGSDARASAATPSETNVSLHRNDTAGVHDGGARAGSMDAVSANFGVARAREAMPSEAAAGEAMPAHAKVVGMAARGVTASEAPASEASASEAADGVEGHASALQNEIPSFLGEGGQGGEGLAALSMPLDSDTSSAFGWRNDPFRGRRKFHSGVDLRAAYGTEVPTAAPGKVTFAGERGAYGLMVVVEHPNGVETRYAHLSSTAVQSGDSVAAGQTIGRVGSSGRSTGPHLHFEVLLDGKRVNPEQIASARSAGSILPQTGSTLAP